MQKQLCYDVSYILSIYCKISYFIVQFIGIQFDENSLKGVPVFRSKESYESVYCTDIFKKAIEGAQLEGLLFSENLTQL